MKRLKRLYQELAAEPYPEPIGEICRRELGLDLTAAYGRQKMDNPFMIASGQMTRFRRQIERISAAGYGGFVFKSFVGQDSGGRSSMLAFRQAPTFIRSVYDEDDIAAEMPIIHWSGRLDSRQMQDYLEFTAGCSISGESGRGSLPVYSFLCHLPRLHEKMLEDEWLFTMERLQAAGARDVEIDFCPFLQSENMLDDQAAVLRWYRECTALLKGHYPEISVYPKLINPPWNERFYLEMMAAAVDGGADGLTIANRIYKAEYGSGHGGRELREKNLDLVSMCRKAFPGLPIAATGGIYSGRHAFAYLSRGASCVQLLSFVMGRVCRPFASSGDKYRQVLHELVFDPERGLAAAMLAAGVDSLKGVADDAWDGADNRRQPGDRAGNCPLPGGRRM